MTARVRAPGRILKSAPQVAGLPILEIGQFTERPRHCCDIGHRWVDLSNMGDRRNRAVVPGYQVGYRCRALGLRQGFPPRNSKCCSFTTEAMDAARPSHGIRANWRADNQAALYQTPGLRPG